MYVNYELSKIEGATLLMAPSINLYFIRNYVFVLSFQLLVSSFDMPLLFRWIEPN